jgi:hypothetical protein
MTPCEVERVHGEEYARWERNPYTFAPAGGETGLSVTARALRALLDIVAAHPGQTVIVLSHKTTIRLLLSSLLGFDPRFYRDHLDQSPAALNVLDFRDDVQARLTLFNDTSHYAQADLAIPQRPQGGPLEVVGCPGVGVDHADRDPRRPARRLDVGTGVAVGGRSFQLFRAWPPHNCRCGVI